MINHISNPATEGRGPADTKGQAGSRPPRPPRPPRRWSDNDHHWGPFTYSKDPHKCFAHKCFALELCSGTSENPGCYFRATWGRHTLLLELPQLIKPAFTWVNLSKASWADSAGYWDEHEVEYGLNKADSSLMLRYGPQTDDITTEKSKHFSLPWLEWCFIRLSFYDLQGEEFWTQLESTRTRTPGLGAFSEQNSAKLACPPVSFSFEDFDGELIVARTIIEEREWHRGTGWCKWLSWFYSPKIRRNLDIEFSSEVGPRKGSWKGGTRGHGIDMRLHDSHKSAFRRYCDEHNMTLVGVVQ